MPFTYEANPIPGEPGIGTSNWGELLNTILTQIKNATNTNATAIVEHGHNSDEINMPGDLSLEDAYQAIIGETELTPPTSLLALKNQVEDNTEELSHFALNDHLHDTRYSQLSHGHHSDEVIAMTGDNLTDVLEGIFDNATALSADVATNRSAVVTHRHDADYSPLGHNHANLYPAFGHEHHANDIDTEFGDDLTTILEDMAGGDSVPTSLAALKTKSDANETGLALVTTQAGTNAANFAGHVHNAAVITTAYPYNLGDLLAQILGASSVEASLSALNVLAQANLAALATKAASGHHHNGDYSAITHGHADLSTSIAALVVKSNANESGLVTKAAADHHHDADYSATNHVHTDLEDDISTVTSQASTNANNLATHHHDADYSASAHTHGTYETAIAQLQALANTLDPDVTNVVISLSITNTYEGIVIQATATPDIYVRRWGFTIKKAGAVVANTGTGADSMLIPARWGFADDDTLEIQARLMTGVSSMKTSDWYAHTYERPTSPFEEQINAISAQLASVDIGAFVRAFVADDNAVQALANKVHTSNALAQKVIDLQA